MDKVNIELIKDDTVIHKSTFNAPDFSEVGITEIIAHITNELPQFVIDNEGDDYVDDNGKTWSRWTGACDSEYIDVNTSLGCMLIVMY